MFLSDFVHLAVAFDELAPILLDADAAWLLHLGRSSGPAGARTLTRDGELAAVEVKVGPSRGVARLTVAVTAGRPRSHDKTVVVPILWEPKALDRLLPTLEADLTLSDQGDDVSRLAISARYHVPLAIVGWELDQVGMHRVAEGSIRQFLKQVEAAILAER